MNTYHYNKLTSFDKKSTVFPRELRATGLPQIGLTERQISDKNRKRESTCPLFLTHLAEERGEAQFLSSEMPLELVL